MTSPHKPLRCKNCQTVLGERVGDALKTRIFTLDFNRSTNILCNQCEAYTTFTVRREKKSFDKTLKSIKI